MKVFWTVFAQVQLESIYDYIRTENLRAAVEIYNDILDKSAMLECFPKMAGKEPLLSEFPEEYRSLMARQNYKVIYYIDSEITIYIVAVFDCRQNPEKLRYIIGSQ